MNKKFNGINGLAQPPKPGYAAGRQVTQQNCHPISGPRMRTPLTALLLMLILAASGCSTATGAIDSCSFEVNKLMLPWVRPDGTVASVISYDLRQSELLYSCIVSKGYVFDNVRANAEFAAGRSPGLLGQYKDSRNWSFGWFGIAKERPALVAAPAPAASASAAPSQASSSR